MEGLDLYSVCLDDADSSCCRVDEFAGQLPPREPVKEGVSRQSSIVESKGSIEPGIIDIVDRS